MTVNIETLILNNLRKGTKMRIKDNKTWDKLIYGLLYPGFLGSLIYELVPTQELIDKFKNDDFSILLYYIKLD